MEDRPPLVANVGELMDAMREGHREWRIRPPGVSKREISLEEVPESSDWAQLDGLLRRLIEHYGKDEHETLQRAIAAVAKQRGCLMAVVRAMSFRRFNQAIDVAIEGNARTPIPADERTKPMSYRFAADLMGKGNSKDAAEWLSKCVAEGTILCEHLSRQMHIFSRKSFLPKVWKRIMPRGDSP